MTKVQVDSNGNVITLNGAALLASGGITPTGTLNISQNGSYNVSNYAYADVSVGGGGGTKIHLHSNNANVTYPDIYWEESTHNLYDSNDNLITYFEAVIVDGSNLTLQWFFNIVSFEGWEYFEGTWFGVGVSNGVASAFCIESNNYVYGANYSMVND